MCARPTTGTQRGTGTSGRTSGTGTGAAGATGATGAGATGAGTAVAERAAAAVGTAAEREYRLAHAQAAVVADPLLAIGGHRPLQPVHAIGRVVAEIHFDDHRFDDHLRKHHIELINELVEGFKVAASAHEQQRVGPLVGQNTRGRRETADDILVSAGDGRESLPFGGRGRGPTLLLTLHEITQGLAPGIAARGILLAGILRRRVRR